MTRIQSKTMIVVLSLMCVFSVLSPQLADATTQQVIGKSSVEGTQMVVRGKLGAEVKEVKPPKKEKEMETIVIDTSKIPSGRLPKTGSTFEHSFVWIGCLLLLLWAFWAWPRELIEE